MTRIVSEDRRAFGKGTESVPVDVQVDTPAGAFIDNNDRISVVLDLNDDRDSQGDPVVELHSDRQCECYLSKTGPKGLISIWTKVSDHTVQLPANGIENVRANAFTTITIANQTRRNDERSEVIFDSQSPQILALAGENGDRIGKGEDFVLVASVTDHNLSGVESIEAAIDLNGIGEITESMNRVPGERELGRGWIVNSPPRSWNSVFTTCWFGREIELETFRKRNRSSSQSSNRRDPSTTYQVRWHLEK